MCVVLMFCLNLLLPADLCMKEGRVVNRQRCILTFISDSESPLFLLRASPSVSINKSFYITKINLSENR